MNTVEILKSARALIADEKNWTQGFYARDENGDPTGNIEKAVCFCSIGAIHKAGNFELDRSLPKAFISQLIIDDALTGYDCAISEGRVVEFNDSHTHPEVLALFDRAIARAEGGEA